MILKSLCFSLIAALCLEGLSASPYLHLDNQTLASFESLLEDPFLAIRTKVGSPAEEPSLARSWEAFARLTLQQEKPLTSDFPLPEHFKSHPSTVTMPTPFLEQTAGQKPVFHLTAPTEETQYVWWQICDKPDFGSICASLNQIMPFTSTLILSDLADTFLNPDQCYYFRARTEASGWTAPYAFQIDKPPSVQEVVFSKQTDNVYTLTWKGQTRVAADFLVFASHAMDFVPDVYANKQVNACYQESVLEEDNCNLVAITKEPFLVIDGTYPFYRIIARNREQLAVPSPLIRIYDHGLHFTRTLLQPDKDEPTWLHRQLLPSQYTTCAYSDPAWLTSLRKGTKERPVGYPHNPFVPPQRWLELEPYFLPINHPLKDRLDRLFHQSRATESPQAFEKAGFGKANMRQPTNIVVGKHAKLEGYVIKVYLDTQPPLYEWVNWLSRIAGAQSIQACINRHGYRDFLVPKKWIYPLPAHPSPPSDGRHHRKDFILVAEDMHILSPKDNEKAFKKKITKKMLKELYTLLMEEGLIDSVFIDNIPFTQSGKIAFIDTEHHHLHPVNCARLTPYFSFDMQRYWQKLVEQECH